MHNLPQTKQGQLLADHFGTENVLPVDYYVGNKKVGVGLDILGERFTGVTREGRNVLVSLKPSLYGGGYVACIVGVKTIHLPTKSLFSGLVAAL